MGLKTENLTLSKDAKMVRHCRDELDTLKEKVSCNANCFCFAFFFAMGDMLLCGWRFKPVD